MNLPQYDVDFEAGRCDPHHLLAYVREADALGFDSVWMSDHPFASAPTGALSTSLDPVPAVAAIAVATSRVQVGTLVLGLSLRSPAEVAAIARAWTVVAPKRIVAGLGAGWNPLTHAALGVARPPFADRTEALDAAAMAVHGLQPRPRVLVGGWGEPVLFAAARHADVWNLAWDPGPADFRSVSKTLDRVCESIGRDPATLARSVGVTVLAAADRRAARRAIGRVATRAPYLSELTLERVDDLAIVGTAEHCFDAIAAYGADEVVIAPFVRDEVAMLEELASGFAAVR